MNRKIAFKLSMLSVVMFFIVMGAFYFINDSQLTNNIRNSAINNMQMVVTERATLIGNSVLGWEDVLKGYSKAGEVKEVLLNPTNKDAVANAQKYTMAFGDDIENLEGLYIADWSTHVLTHYNESAIGITMRTDELLKALQTSLLEANGVYNTGIVLSPASGNQVVSMYMPIYDNDVPVGMVGCAIHTGGLKATLDSLPKNGMENANYFLINTKTGEYIFHGDDAMVGQMVDDAGLLEAWDACRGMSNGFYENGNGDIYAFHNMTDRGWCFVVTDTAEEIFASVNVTKNILKGLTIATVVVLMVFTFIMINVAMKPLTILEKALLKLANYDITEDKSFKKYVKRNDEIGGIASAVDKLLDSYRSIIPTIQNASTTLKDIASELNTNTGIATETCDQIAQAIENVASGAVSQADDTTKASTNIMSMSDELTKINGNTEDLQSISVSMDSAKENAMNTLAELQKATIDMIEDVNNTSEQVRVTSESMNGIKEAVKMIDNIASQTHLLSLNASIEASKAGESGRGFAVVATEMGKLSHQSKEYSNEIKKIIAEVEKNYELIIETVNTTNNNMQVQSEKLTDTQNVFAVLDGNISDTVERIGSINHMVESLSKELTEIVDMLSNLSAISQENSASTQETMAGIEELNTIIMQVNEKASVVNGSADSLIEEVGVFKVE